jgi:hypothetical protein
MSRKDDAQCFYAMELVEGETLEACHFANYLAELFARYLSHGSASGTRAHLFFSV